MGRTPQPLALAKVKGAHKKNPGRYAGALAVEKEAKDQAKDNPGSPASAMVSALGLPPDYLSTEARKVWLELEDYLPPGVVTKADRVLFEMTCNLVADFRRSPARFPVNKYPIVVKCLGHLGLTPADRRKLALPEGKKGNPFEDFLKAPKKPNA